MTSKGLRSLLGLAGYLGVAAGSGFGMVMQDGSETNPSSASVGAKEPRKIDLDHSVSTAPDGAFDQLATGYRRTTNVQRLPISAAQREAFVRIGKVVRLDPQSGEQIREMIRDYLPVGWGQYDDAMGPADSLGRPIVNEVSGLPGWSQADVDALRSEIAEWLVIRADQIVRGTDLTETDGVLGNFVGQAIVRGIPIDDLVILEDSTQINSGAAGAILGYLHFYENLKSMHADDGRYSYQVSVYPDRIAAFAEAHGARMDELLRLDEQEGEVAGGQPSGCYSRTAFSRGMTNLSGQTDIWVANGFDDEQADIPTGFPLFFFYDCQDADNNDTVRVSTNGYISFFQQGGGAAFGTVFSNDAIPLTDNPDGYAGPWWDDLIVATNQGNTDRVSYKTEGAVDSRVFTVEWFSMSRLNGTTTDFHFFQVKLYETTDVVELHISADWAADTIDNATVGIENYTGAGGDCGPNCTNTNNAPPPNNYRFAPVPRPDNDACGSAIELINGASVVGNLHRATSDGNATCGGSSNNRDVWYTFVARCNGTLHVNTCGSRDIDGPVTGVDTVLSVHSGCPGTTANQLACNDDAGQSGCSGNDSAVVVSMTTGQRVFIRVTHFGDLAFRFASGAFRLNLDFVSTSAPTNDNCGAAGVILNGNTLIGNLLCASNDGSADCGSSEGNPNIWYRFTAPGGTGGVLTLSTCGSRNNAGADTGPDTVLSVHSGCPGTSGNELTCNDDGFQPGCNALDSTADVFLAPGQSVVIRVTHFGSTASRVGNGFTVLHADFGPCVRADS
ncbi:MAG: hypothetical protein JNG88_13660, partial [Phycisphaerales bacterium]|nr:hypothetical protein [Phycisphaerales bacterium]